jgi:excisionase family DNA binding protein
VSTRLLTVREAAEMLRIHPDTLREHLRAGRVRGMKVGSQWRVPEDVAEVPPLDPLPPRRREPRGEFARLAREIQDASRSASGSPTTLDA